MNRFLDTLQLPVSQRELLAWLDAQLEPVTHSPEQLQAERNGLLTHVNLRYTDILAHPERPVTHDIIATLQPLLQCRCQQRMPIQYVLEHAEFYGLPFKVTPAVLIPRPETERLVEQALAYIDAHNITAMADLGTGSGCIAIAIQHHRPHVTVHAVDLSQAALEIAQYNAQQLQTPIQFHYASWLEGFAPQSIPFIVSNPPYIAAEAAPTLAPEVLQEPHSALFSPQAPEALYSDLLTQASHVLTKPGAIFLELGHNSGEAVQVIAQQLGYRATLQADYNQIARFLHAHWH